MSSRELVVASPITVAPEAMLEYICGVGSCAENLHTQQKTIRCRLGSRKHLGRKNTVEKSLYFGMNPIDSCHLRFVGAGHYGSLHPIPV